MTRHSLSEEKKHGIRILLVEDNPVNQKVALSMLKRLDYRADVANNGLAVLSSLERKAYDVILMDIQMPGMDGFELCKSLRALPGYRRTPVIYVTSHSDFDTRARSVLSGSNDLIAKPIFPMELAVKALTHLLKSQLAGQKPVR